MEGTMKGFLIGAIIVAVAVGLPAEAAKKKAKGVAMTGAELHVLLDDGQDLILGGAGMGYEGSLALKSDGTGEGDVKTSTGEIFAIKGVWRITGDKFCRTWEGGRDAGKEICERWLRSGDKSVTVMVDKKNYGVNSWK